MKEYNTKYNSLKISWQIVVNTFIFNDRELFIADLKEFKFDSCFISKVQSVMADIKKVLDVLTNRVNAGTLVILKNTLQVFIEKFHPIHDDFMQDLLTARLSSKEDINSFKEKNSLPYRDHEIHIENLIKTIAAMDIDHLPTPIKENIKKCYNGETYPGDEQIEKHYDNQDNQNHSKELKFFYYNQEFQEFMGED